jgi:8-oxo-dGTP pyrophosphatase MutT (NUDIX family)
MDNLITCKNNFGETVDVPREKFYFRPSVYGFILDQGKVVTMRNKSNNKLWFPGGGMEVGEKMEDALKREAKEETGLEITIDKLLLFKENFFYYQPLDEAYHAFLFFFLCRTHNPVIIGDELVDDLESKKPRWTNIKEINKEDISDLSEDIHRTLGTLT